MSISRARTSGIFPDSSFRHIELEAFILVRLPTTPENFVQIPTKNPPANFVSDGGPESGQIVKRANPQTLALSSDNNTRTSAESFAYAKAIYRRSRCQACFWLARGQAKEDLFGIRVPGEYRKSAINLLCQHHASQFVRERQWRERNSQRRSLCQRLRKSFGSSAQKNDFALTSIAAQSDPFSELFRTEVFPGSIEQHDCASRIGIHAFQARCRFRPQFP